MQRRTNFMIMLVWGAAIMLNQPSLVMAREFLLASTTSTENSGLFAYLLPIFEAHSGIKTRVIAVGTGHALRLARNGDADALLVHDAIAEKKFVADGFGVNRRRIMYNDFVLLGPMNDPASVASRTYVLAALRAIADRRAVFVSRGDDSGTHRAERRHWDAVGINVAAASGRWYREAGAGMGATLNIASSLDGYVIADRATWLSFRNKGNLKILIEGDPSLFNQYGVLRVDPKRHPHVNTEAARAFVEWLSAPTGQNAIGSFRVEGKQLFFPNYNSQPGS